MLHITLYKQRLITLLLLLAIILTGIRLEQQFITLHFPASTPHHAIVITCAVAVAGGIGQLCVSTDAGARIEIVVSYASGGQAHSPLLTKQTPGTRGEYRWMWQVPRSAAGTQASAQVSASWPSSSPQQGAQAVAVFRVAPALS